MGAYGLDILKGVLGVFVINIDIYNGQQTAIEKYFWSVYLSDA